MSTSLLKRSRVSAVSQMTKPPIKYLGGKGQFVDAIASRMPPKFGRGTFGNYYEPFLGGGAIALNMLLQSVPRKAYLSDITPELINMWQCIQRNPLKLFRAISDLKTPTCLEDYLAIRTAYNAAKCRNLKMGATWIDDMDDGDRFAIAAMYIWLNKTCVNGIYRVDKKKNEFNVSWNKNLKPCLPTKNHLSEVSLIIRNAEITCQSFATALKEVQENDLVYVDPPYDDTFNEYSTDGFGVQGQVYLFNVLQNIGSRGAHVFASNSDTPYVRSLYKDWEHIVLLRKGTVNSDGSDRGKVNELLLIKKTMKGEIAA